MFVVDGGFIVGTMIGFVLSYSLIFLVVALLFLFKIKEDKMEIDHDSLDVELA